MIEKYYAFTVLVIPLFIIILFAFLGGLIKGDKEKIFSLVCKFIYLSQILFSLALIFDFLPYHMEFEFPFVELHEYSYVAIFELSKLNLILATAFALLFFLIEILSYTYLHAEEEHHKFYSLKLIFNFACLAFVFSTNIDFLFFNWEIVGISSALLISYFYRRNQAVTNSSFAFSVYRFCDAAFFLICLLLFHFYHSEETSFIAPAGLNTDILGILIVITILGKSGQFPFTSWLPLALEGPTPSSTLYYTALSTHLGALLLIKTHGIWDASLITKSFLMIISIITLLQTATSARVQANIKGAIGYSTMSQVALILIEIALGFHTFAIVHIILHMFYRTNQLLLAPSIIDQHNRMEQIYGENFAPDPLLLRFIPKRLGEKLYFLALNGFNTEKLVVTIFKVISFPFAIIIYLENKLLNFDNQENTQHIFSTDKNIGAQNEK